ncbi:alpha/beta-Hydrolases superfamily protein [Striga hermonthica]|uniref:Alpha/beta-Hydrolases superfamily protein n=1 Tax=Striga hermonthica TaxID=68872 RepID=A0A9N7MXM8_STRHE|nr:alpha/beta-Hydrolases superfamily protein [Striga hermonthica]
MASYGCRILARPLFNRSKSSSFSRFSSVNTRFIPSSSLRQVRAMATNSDVSSPFKKVQIERDNSTFDAYVIGRDDAPGIVVLQEWWGVDFEIKNHAQKIVGFDKGYKALIPDLYGGRVGLNAAEAQHLMDSLDWKGAVKDIEASVKWLKAEGSKKVGVTGFCMGSALAIASSVLVPGIDAVVSFYGVPSRELADVNKAEAPVQAHFGQLDTFVGFSDVETAKSLQYELWRAGKNEFFIRPTPGTSATETTPKWETEESPDLSPNTRVERLSLRLTRPGLTDMLPPKHRNRQLRGTEAKTAHPTTSNDTCNP